MVILIFGVSNVGKTVSGRILAQRLHYSFYDLDMEITKRQQMTLESFINKNPFPYERHKIKGKLLKDLVMENIDNNVVIAVSPIFYARFFNALLDLKQVLAIELQDTKEHIFQRLVFSDENDNIFEDEEYKEQHSEYYLKQIHEDIMYVKKIHKKIENKYFVNNQSVEQVVDGLIEMIQNICIEKDVLAANGDGEKESI